MKPSKLKKHPFKIIKLALVSKQSVGRRHMRFNILFSIMCRDTMLLQCWRSCTVSMSVKGRSAAQHQGSPTIVMSTPPPEFTIVQLSQGLLC